MRNWESNPNPPRGKPTPKPVGCGRLWKVIQNSMHIDIREQNYFNSKNSSFEHKDCTFRESSNSFLKYFSIQVKRGLDIHQKILNSLEKKKVLYSKNIFNKQPSPIEIYSFRCRVSKLRETSGEEK